MKLKSVVVLLLACLAAGCSNSSTIAREGFLYDGRVNRFVFRSFLQMTHYVYEDGDDTEKLHRFHEIWEVRFIGPRVSDAKKVEFRDEETRSHVEVDYNGTEGRSDRFRLRVGRGGGLELAEGANTVNYEIFGHNNLSLARGSLRIDVSQMEKQLPPATVIVPEPPPYYYYGGAYWGPGWHPGFGGGFYFRHW
jgi:hypothetical protein